MSSPTIDMSVVIVTWNSAAYIRACLDSLRADAGQSLECFVVDNASSDGTADLVRRDFPWATVVEAGGNRGFAAANNLALRLARGKILLLLNPDAELQPGALAALRAALERHPRAAAIGPRLVNGDGSLQFSTYRLPTLATIGWEYFLRDVRRPDDARAGRYSAADYGRERPVEGLLGACILLRREAVDEVGLLDERYVMYCEEVDWCLRLHRAGWEVWYTPAATVVHHGGQSARLAPARTFLELQRSRFKLYSTWWSPGGRLALETITRAGMLYQMTFWLKQWLRGRIDRAQLLDRLRLSLRVLALRPSGAPW